MESAPSSQTSNRVLFCSFAAALAAAVLFLVEPFLASHAAPGIATYSRGVLHLALPYQAPHRGAGRFMLEVVDPENQVLGRIEKSLEVGEGSGEWKEELKLNKPLPLDDLVWQRVRYRFAYDNRQFPDLEGVESISEILRMPILHIRGQQSYLSGSPAAVRVVVTDSQNDPIPGRATLRIDLKGPDQGRRALFTGRVRNRNHASSLSN